MQPVIRDGAFRVFRRFNSENLDHIAGLRKRANDRAVALFSGTGLADRLARELCRRRALPIKELLESFEFFQRVRRCLRAHTVVDLCCGHGLTGILFAVFEPSTGSVLLVDRCRPPSHGRVLDAVRAVAPWVVDKVSYREDTLKSAVGQVPAGASIAAVHACGQRTDRAIDAAIAARGNLAVMPCCYSGTVGDTPRAVRRALGAELAADVDRTYRLEEAGWSVEWTAIPRAITAMNRILLARRE